MQSLDDNDATLVPKQVTLPSIKEGIAEVQAQQAATLNISNGAPTLPILPAISNTVLGGIPGITNPVESLIIKPTTQMTIGGVTVSKPPSSGKSRKKPEQQKTEEELRKEALQKETQAMTKIFKSLYPDLVDKNGIKYPIEDNLI